MMATYRVCAKVTLRAEHQPTGGTVHRCGNEVLPTPSSLTICQLDQDPGYYLLYFDDAGDELTDTYHETMLDAMKQAKWEFGVESEDWETF